MAASIPVLPVIFRAEKSGDFKNHVTAVFPTLPGSGAHDFTVYAHVGQHGTGSHGWYAQTRAAKPAEYAPLLAELRRIYEGDPREPVRLRVVERFSGAYDAERRKNLTRFESPSASKHESGGNPRTTRYRGVEIEATSGGWYVAFIPELGYLKSDTLAGARELVRNALAKPGAAKRESGNPSATKHESGGNPRIVGKTDERVLRAFVDKRAAVGNKYTSDGRRLDGMWLGGSNIASWEPGPRGGVHIIVLHDTGGKTAQSIHRKIRKIAGPIAKYEWEIAKRPGAARHESGGNPKVDRRPVRTKTGFAHRWGTPSAKRTRALGVPLGRAPRSSKDAALKAKIQSLVGSKKK